MVLGLVSTIAQATVVTYKFSGVFDAPTRLILSGDANHAPLFNGMIKEGDRFSGQFSFDTDASAVSEPKPGINWVLYPAIDFQLRATDAFNIAVPFWQASDIQVTDDQKLYGEVLYDELISVGSARLDSLHTMVTHLRMFSADASAFNNFRVPVGYQNFTGVSIMLQLFHSDHAILDRIHAKVDLAFVEAGAVPEPASGLLLLAGLGGFTLLRRRRA